MELIKIKSHYGIWNIMITDIHHGRVVPELLTMFSFNFFCFYLNNYKIYLLLSAYEVRGKVIFSLYLSVQPLVSGALVLFWRGSPWSLVLGPFWGLPQSGLLPVGVTMDKTEGVHTHME